MKHFILYFILGICAIGTAQTQHYNTSKGYVAKGYDVVAYFQNKAVKGRQQFTTFHDNVKYKFVSQENLKYFEASPENYIPQYGGYCAYAIGITGKKVGVNPKTFEIRDGKLYLFYNSFGVNTLMKWREEDIVNLKEKADKNWYKMGGAQ